MNTVNELIKRLEGPVTLELLNDVNKAVRKNKGHDSATAGYMAEWLRDNTDLVVLTVLDKNGSRLTRYALDERVAEWTRVGKREITSFFNQGSVLASLLDDKLIDLVDDDNQRFLRLTDKGLKKLEGMR